MPPSGTSPWRSRTTSMGRRTPQRSKISDDVIRTSSPQVGSEQLTDPLGHSAEPLFEDCDEDSAFVKRLVQGVTTCWILLKHLVPFVIGRYKKVGKSAQGALTLLDVLGCWLFVGHWTDGTCVLTVGQLAAKGCNSGASFSAYDRS